MIIRSGGLSRSMAYALENEAYRKLPQYLRTHHQIEVLEKFVRTEIGGEQVNFFAKARQNGAEIVIIGESVLKLDNRGKLKQLREMNREERAKLLESYGVYRKLSPEQRDRLERNYRRFRSLPPGRQQQLRNAYRRFMRMPPERRARMLENFRKWQELTPEERESILSQTPPK